MLTFKREIGVYSDRDSWGARVGRIDFVGRWVKEPIIELGKEESRELGAIMEKVNNCSIDYGEEITCE